MFHVVEVIETKQAYKPNQKDEKGNPLFNGSILVRTGGVDSILGQVKNIWCAPATFNKRIPLVGEQVLIFEAPGVEASATDFKTKRFYYFTPYNTVNDVSNHNFPLFWKRDKNLPPFAPNQKSDILADKKELGYTISKKMTGTRMLQPFEGDDIWEGRFGQTIRFTRSYKDVNSPGDKIYEVNSKKYWPARVPEDPIAIIKVKRPSPGSNFDLEDIQTDQSSIYLTTSQKILRFKGGSTNNCDAKGISNWDKGSQVIIDADRIVVNAKNDNAFMLAKNKSIISAKRIILQTDKNKVDVDDLMLWLKKFINLFREVVTGESPLTTAMGPTGPGKNAPQTTKLANVDYKLAFKKKGCGNITDADIRASLDAAVEALKSASNGTDAGPVSSAINSNGANSNADSSSGDSSSNSQNSNPSQTPEPSAAENSSSAAEGGSAGASAGSQGTGGPSAPGSFGVFLPTRPSKRVDSLELANKRNNMLKKNKCISEEGKAKGFQKVNKIAGGLPASANFNTPLSVEVGEKAAPVLRNNGLSITDTNDYINKDDGRGHKSLHQQHGTSFDCDFIGGRPNANQILKVIQDGKKQGLRFEWEVKTAEERDFLLKQNPNLKGSVKVVDRITGSHFSVYPDGGGSGGRGCWG